MAKTASQVRAELLGEHFRLRRLVEEARSRLGPESAEALPSCVERLADALFSHSRHEEQALRGLLAPIHARAPGRFAIMDEAHVAEHARLVGELRAFRAADPVTRRDGVSAILDALETHMTEEEEVLLAEDRPDDRDVLSPRS